MRIHDQALILIGRYMVLSITLAGILVVRDIGVPFWCAFPIMTIWMILRDQFVEARTLTRDNETKHD